MVDLEVCIEGIRQALIHGRNIILYQRQPKKLGESFGRSSIEGFIEALKAIAENCPLPEDTKRYYLRKYNDLKKMPWKIAMETIEEKEFVYIPAEALEYVRDYVKFFKPE